MPKHLPASIAILSLALVMAIDWLTPPYVLASGFYLLPIWIAAWFCGKPFLTAITAISVISNVSQNARIYPIEVHWWEVALSWFSVGLIMGGFGMTMVVLRNAFDKKTFESLTDPLTGILNRRGLFDRFEIEIARTNRLRSALVVAIIDIDNFKLINDLHGHPTGDEALIRTAKEIQSTLRSVDVVGRLGGDEFAVVLPDTQENDAALVLQRVQQRLHELLNRYDTQASASIGAIIAASDNVLGATDLLSKADQVLYSIKNNGKDSFRIVHL